VTFAAVAGGGTAGHVLPALAVAESLVAAGHDAGEILYVGTSRGIEARMLPLTAFRACLVDVVGFQRSLDRRNLGRNLRRDLVFVPKMIGATRRMITEFRGRPPAVVVSVGGYASMPSVFAARRLGIPVVVVSYDRTPGRASRLAARRAAACAVAFDGSRLPRAVVTGAPVRQAILDVDRVADRDEARRALDIPTDRFLVVVVGGSLGSAVLNDAIGAYLDAHRADSSLAVLQVTGERFASSIASAGDGNDGVLHRVVAFETNMPAVYAAADLLVGRGGASTVHEVAVTGIPAILVPWPGAADDHQTDNVEWLVEVGGAVLVADREAATPGPSGIGATIDRLRHDDDARAQLGRRAARRGDVHRSGALAGLIERVAISSPPS
jgi:UDP-N-acetylglucosamine--N-acetylmuramyl-(pentapeptide) pyrophosphoryl-undecaprenol N-acetylglucosamine transferase